MFIFMRAALTAIGKGGEGGRREGSEREGGGHLIGYD